MLAAQYGPHPSAAEAVANQVQLDRPGATLAMVAAGPAIAYACRARLIPEEEMLRPQAGGWAGAAVFAIAVVLLALLAAIRMPGRRLSAWTTLPARLFRRFDLGGGARSARQSRTRLGSCGRRMVRGAGCGGRNEFAVQVVGSLPSGSVLSYSGEPVETHRDARPSRAVADARRCSQVASAETLLRARLNN
jgi:hypothetical protein